MHSSQYPAAASFYPPELAVEVAPGPAPAAPTFGAKRAVSMFCAYVGAQLAVAIGVGLAVGVAYGISHRGRTGAPPVGAAAVLTIAVLGALLGSALVYRMARRSLGASFARTLGLRSAPRRQLLLAAAVGIGICACFTVLSARVFAPPSMKQLSPLALAAAQQGWSRCAWAVLASLIAPITEEFVFRGALFSGLASSWSPRVAAFITTCVFVLMHVTSMPPYWPALGSVFVLAAAAQIARMRSDSLLPGTVMHAAYNAGLAAVVYAASSSTLPSP